MHHLRHPRRLRDSDGAIAKVLMEETKQEQLNSANGPETTSSAKRPYVKPDFQFEQVFETNALSCGKVNSTQGGCHFNRKLS